MHLKEGMAEHNIVQALLLPRPEVQTCDSLTCINVACFYRQQLSRAHMAEHQVLHLQEFDLGPIETDLTLAACSLSPMLQQAA